jgi:hypothetical protein
MENREPVYPNYFTIQLELPVGVGSTQENTNLLLESVQKISGLTSSRFPETPVVQQYKIAKRRYAGAIPTDTTMDITVDFEVNLDETPSAYQVKTLRKWCDLVYDPLTGRTGMKKDYVAPWMLITLYTRGDKPFWQWKAYNVFPGSGIPAIDLDYKATDIYRISNFKILADYWDETIL